jgi:hypothetical protein
MKKRLLGIIVPLLLSLACLGGGLAVNRWGGAANAVLRVRAAELMMVEPGGLRLGRRPTRKDIALVMFDVRTATELGYVRSYTDDIELYRRLIATGASVVYDTRSCAAASEQDFIELKPLLDQMLVLTGDNTPSDKTSNSNGSAADPSPADQAEPLSPQFPRVLREIYLSSHLQGGDILK